MPDVKRKRVASITEEPRPQRHVQQPSDTINASGDAEQLCETCKAIDFDSLFRVKSNLLRQSELLCRIGTPLLSSACSACRFFAAMANPPSPGDALDQAFQLRAYSALKRIGTNSKPKGISDSVFVAVVPNTLTLRHLDSSTYRKGLKYILPSYFTKSIQRRFVGRRVLPEIADLCFVREWIETCRERHGKGCNEMGQIAFEGFKVIDCTSKLIIDAPEECSYVALSYVWGQSETTPFARSLPASCPLAIKDAMRVAQTLGFQYLWVDRYCVNQGEASEKHRQIVHMDSVYANAELTIVAAAGDGPSFGLPGVSSRVRVPQPHLQVKNCTLVSTLDNPCEVINTSHWVTRAWTYQEGLLSRRRLIFTEQQVYFQCHGMHCLESISMPVHFLHGHSARFREDIHTFRFFPNVGIARKAKDFELRVNEYIQRSLSYDSDILFAIMGVLRMFKQMPIPLHHIMGVPLFPMTVQLYIGSLRSQKEISMHRSLAIGLAWNLHSGGQLTRLRRRLGFPSWSWAGWAGWKSMSFPHLSFSDSHAFHGPNAVFPSLWEEPESWEIKISLEDSTNDKIPWDDSDLGFDSWNTPTLTVSYLSITTNYTDISISKLGGDFYINGERGPFSRFHEIDIQLFSHVGEVPVIFQALLLANREELLSGSVSDVNPYTFVTCLLVLEIEKTYMRVGTLSCKVEGAVAVEPPGMSIRRWHGSSLKFRPRTFRIG